VVSAEPKVVEKTIRKQIEQLVQLNEGQPYTYERATLIQMLDDALTTARPRVAAEFQMKRRDAAHPAK